MNIQWIVSPLVGAVIGYFTNWLAIKMLFRPSEAVYLWGHQLPFTPGLIPKEKHRLAVAIGDGISRELLSADIIKQSLLSAEMIEKVDGAISALIQNGESDERTLSEVAKSFVGGDAFDNGASKVKSVIIEALQSKLMNADLGSIAGKAIVTHAKEKSPSALAGLVSSLIDDRIKQTITKQLGDGVNNYIRENGPQLVQTVIDTEADKLMDTRLCDLVAAHRDKLPELRARLLDGYKQLVDVGAERACAAIDLAGIVRGRIDALSNRELESMIFAVIDKELTAIVRLGALLGFIMGFTSLIGA